MCKTVANGLLVYLLVSYLDSVLMEMVLDFLGRETDAGSNAHRHAVFRRVMGTRQRATQLQITVSFVDSLFPSLFVSRIFVDFF